MTTGFTVFMIALAYIIASKTGLQTTSPEMAGAAVVGLLLLLAMLVDSLDHIRDAVQDQTKALKDIEQGRVARGK